MLVLFCRDDPTANVIRCHYIDASIEPDPATFFTLASGGLERDVSEGGRRSLKHAAGLVPGKRSSCKPRVDIAYSHIGADGVAIQSYVAAGARGSSRQDSALG